MERKSTSSRRHSILFIERAVLRHKNFKDLTSLKSQYNQQVRENTILNWSVDIFAKRDVVYVNESLFSLYQAVLRKDMRKEELDGQRSVDN